MILNNLNRNFIRNNYFNKRISIKKMSTSNSKNRKHVAVSYESDEEVKSKKSRNVPNNWEIIYENIKQMRAQNVSPVDNMGCEKCSDPKVSPENQRFQILVALMLSSQTKDEVTFAACQRLRTFGFTPQKIAKVDQIKLEEILKPVGFYRTKAKHIIETSKILIENYDSDVPNDLNELLKLPGVGKKMANIALSSCWNNVVGIGVDVHVHRICNRLKWVNTKTPEKTQEELEAWLPREYWKDVNLMLVGFGQSICTPKNPKCNQCLNNKICPNAFKESPNKKSKK